MILILFLIPELRMKSVFDFGTSYEVPKSKRKSKTKSKRKSKVKKYLDHTPRLLRAKRGGGIGFKDPDGVNGNTVDLMLIISLFV